MFNVSEAASRWSSIGGMMRQLDLDVLVAIDLSRDEILLGHQRWITGYIPIGGPAAALVDREGSVELISDRLGKPVTDHYRGEGFPIALTSGYSARLVAERVALHAPRRVGLVETESASSALAAALLEAVPSVTLVDASAALLALRMIKSAAEIVLVRKSSAIADDVWAHMPEIFRAGRPTYAVAADIDHLVRLRGAEGGFHLVLRLPFLGRPMRSTANPEPIAADARYLVEISPRFEGYYSQLTIPVTTIPDDRTALAAYADVVAAKEAAQPLMRPGVALAEVGEFVRSFLAARGRTMASASLGHFCGMALEEPRHDPNAPMILEEGMTMIFHPVLSDPAFHSLMRADTYLITSDGAERLTRYAGGMLTIG